MNRQQLEEAGVDVDAALERLIGNTDILEMLLKKVFTDSNFDELREALEQQDTDKAFMAAHTLKGVCISLCFRRLYEPVSEMTECLREGDLSSAQALFPAVTIEYGRLTAGLSKYFKN